MKVEGVGVGVGDKEDMREKEMWRGKNSRNREDRERLFRPESLTSKEFLRRRHQAGEVLNCCPKLDGRETSDSSGKTPQTWGRNQNVRDWNRLCGGENPHFWHHLPSLSLSLLKDRVSLHRPLNIHKGRLVCEGLTLHVSAEVPEPSRLSPTVKWGWNARLCS